ncbi:unnamed protein product [Blepharisma stoltei]|uniref:RBR-type E3 ubiquitin transferase n=1 Tax=Blepharisma stoltei TaxID=1481888 RepID=A0AAU9JZ31_9CILI|nr:unnamed protein product [Blepharisma stoltei]
MDPSVIKIAMYIRQLNEIMDSKQYSKAKCKEVLDKIGPLLKNSQYQCIPKIIFNFDCANCHTKDLKKRIKLTCNHFICSPDCLKNLIEKITNGNIKEWRTSGCPVEGCAKEIPKEIIALGYGGPDELDKLLEPLLQCGICTMSKRASEFITLDCDHRYCEECFRGYFADLITQGKTSREHFVCPECSDEIDMQIITSRLSVEEREKLETYLLKNWQPSEEDKLNSIYFKCPTPNCTYSCLVPCNYEEVECLACAQKWCPRCQNPPHPQMTCEAYKERLNMNDDIKALMENENFTVCPWCQVLIEKNKGCKYMACTSEKCKGKRYFCFDCRTKLLERHQKHECPTPDILRNRCSVF